MFRKRTRSSNTSAKNPIVIQDDECLLPIIDLRAQVTTKANLKGAYVQGCIIAHDLESLVENVHELNPLEPSEPTELETDESSNKSEMEANSVTEIEEVKFREESNDPEPIKEPKASEPREDMNVNRPVETSVDPELTIPMPTSSSLSWKKGGQLANTNDVAILGNDPVNP
ncbi:hypothetical protein PVK06_024395 [Gossypium arboreum]|uniref:Uncharacterized protein n=1 Tax=Gossypium arboreum TaxID=29729 RepID=A0ABR0PDL4_GOSAR|nr:hypothetical protein PVK06_024395 [Gossypium arboreum]